MLLLIAVVLQGLAGIRAAARMIASAGGAPLGSFPPVSPGSITAVVPVLDEERRVGAALEALAAVGPSLAAILVVDGGSSDGTAAVVARAAERDPRIRAIDASPVPPGWNGKAWNLEVGLRAARTPWLATIDADVRIGSGLLDASVARAESAELAGLSVATRQRLADAGSAILHPAFLCTLIYRGGLPNVATGDPARVQANGQVFVARRDALVASDAFRAARASRCEDITTARVLAAAGGRVGFYEGDATVLMHDSWRDCAANWPRSLTLGDAFVPQIRTWASLIELALAQALPLPTLLLVLALGDRVPFARFAVTVLVALVMMRVGVLAGSRRAYVNPPPAYWLAPLADAFVVGAIVKSALQRVHVWRGRTLVSDGAAA